jgi:hypothetical protein
MNNTYLIKSQSLELCQEIQGIPHEIPPESHEIPIQCPYNPLKIYEIPWIPFSKKKTVSSPPKIPSLLEPHEKSHEVPYEIRNPTKSH